MISTNGRMIIYLSKDRNKLPEQGDSNDDQKKIKSDGNKYNNEKNKHKAIKEVLSIKLEVISKTYQKK